jgi:hypothetical protein
VVLDPQNGHHYPLLSMVAPANHHDKLVLPQPAAMAQAMGLAIQVITAAAAYGDAQQNRHIKPEPGERSYNLFKHQAGLEPLRLKSQHVVPAAATLAHLATVPAAMAAPHRLAGKEKRPKQLPLAA